MQNPEQVVRREDWPELLHGFLESRKARPFAWGENDCALLLCDAVLAMTGVDLAAEFRGKYRSEVGAARVLSQKLAPKKRGDAEQRQNLLERLAEAIAAEYGFECVLVGLARRGDAVLIETDLGPALGVVALDGMNARFAGLDGMHAIALRECRRAWRIG